MLSFSQNWTPEIWLTSARRQISVTVTLSGSLCYRHSSRLSFKSFRVMRTRRLSCFLFYSFPDTNRHFVEFKPKRPELRMSFPNFIYYNKDTDEKQKLFISPLSPIFPQYLIPERKIRRRSPPAAYFLCFFALAPCGAAGIVLSDLAVDRVAAMCGGTAAARLCRGTSYPACLRRGPPPCGGGTSART